MKTCGRSAQAYGKYAALVDAMLYRDKLAEKVGGYFIDKIEKEICPYYNTIKRPDNKFGHVWCCTLIDICSKLDEKSVVIFYTTLYIVVQRQAQ